MKTPKDLDFFDGTLACHPPEFDDMGGGAPGIYIEGFLYNTKSLDKLVKILLKRRKWLAGMNKKYGN